MYNWIVWLHVACVFVFLLAHGVAMGVSFQVRNERQVERLRGLLDLSTSVYRAVYVTLILILLTGILLGFMGGWWRQGWIWASLALLVIEVGAMTGLARRDYLPLRKALGLHYFEGNRLMPAGTPAPDAEALALAGRTQPGLLAGIGGVGLLLILWLMILKPF